MIQNQNQNQTVLDYPRLSTHILLGDHLRERNPNNWLANDGRCGCALGGAILSAGKLIGYADHLNAGHITRVWSWLDRLVPSNPEDVNVHWFPEFVALSGINRKVEKIPLGAYGPYTAERLFHRTFLWAISDLFIRVHHGSLTIEALVDQVRLWEEVYDDQLIATLAADSNHGQGDRDLVAVAEFQSVSVR